MVQIDPRRLDQEPLWRITERLVAFDTVSTNSSLEAARFLADEIDLPGWTVRVHEEQGFGASKGSVVAVAGPPEPGGLILSGHLDVVPFASQPGWTRDALVLGRDEHRIYGRGVADMKGFLAQCVVLAQSLDLGRLRRPLAFVFTSDEEVGCLGSGRLVDHLPSLFGSCPMPDRAVIGEPTSFRVYGAHKGHVRCAVQVEGSPGHSSRPDLGLSAIGAAAEVVRAIERFAEGRGRQATEEHRQLFPDFPGIPFNVGTIAGGSAVNMIAERCEMTLGFRHRPGDDAHDLLATVSAEIRDSVESRYPGASVQLADVLVTPPLHQAPEGPVADALRDLSLAAVFLGAPFATDGGQFERAGIRSYIWGPGELSQAHQPDESMPITSFVRMPSLLEQLVYRVCGDCEDDGAEPGRT